MNIFDTSRFSKQIFIDSALITKFNDRDTIKYTKLTYTDSALSTKFKMVDTIKFTKQMYTDSALQTKLNINGNAISATIAKTDFINLLKGEYRKEFYGESQSFFMHKRLNLDIITTAGLIYPASDKIFVFPLPIEEQTNRN